MSNFQKFPSIEKMSDAIKHMHRNSIDAVEYIAKIKLHGTNAAIRYNVVDQTVTAQKRTSDVFPESDNAGFASWLEPKKEVWSDMSKQIPATEHVIWYGEWAGPGVQKTDAVSKLGQKYFFVFALQIDDLMISCPDTISEYLVKQWDSFLDDVIILPAFMENFTISSFDAAAANTKIDELNEIVEQIGERDPFIYEMFEVDGVGEGLVLAPFTKTGINRDTYSGLVCKLKSEAHRVQKTAKAASRVVEVPAGTTEFVDMFVTPQRISQAVIETGADGMKSTKDVISWMHRDIMKESVNELEEMNIQYDAIAKYVTPAIVKQFHLHLSKV